MLGKIRVREYKKTAKASLAVFFGSEAVKLEGTGLQIHGWVHGAEARQCGTPVGGGGGGGGGCTIGLVGLEITVALGAANAVVRKVRAIKVPTIKTR